MSGAALPAHAAATARSRGGSSRPLRRRLSVPRAGGAAAPAPAPPPPLPGAFDDDALPDSLYDAVVQAASCSAAAVSAGERNLLVELNVPELFDTTSGNIMAQPGDQQRAWELCREFVEQLRAALDLPPSSPARALFPDAGAAAMLASRWAGRGFEVGSLRGASRTAGIGGTATSAAGAAHSPGDGLLVVCCPDPQGAEAARAAARAAAEDGVPVVLLNPRLASGDAGIGLSARRLKDEFLGKLTVAYSLRPVGDGTVLKKFPGLYQVFVPDAARPGRFRMVAETAARPAGEDLVDLIEDATRVEAGEAAGGNQPEGLAAVAANLSRTAGSMMRFMRALSG